MKINEITFDQFPLKWMICSYHMFKEFSPAIYQDENGNYVIRIKVGQSWAGQYTTINWGYFKLDNTGLIILSPRGYGKLYNRKVRITNMPEMVEWYKDKVINE